MLSIFILLDLLIHFDYLLLMTLCGCTLKDLWHLGSVTAALFKPTGYRYFEFTIPMFAALGLSVDGVTFRHYVHGRSILNYLRNISFIIDFIREKQLIIK